MILKFNEYFKISENLEKYNESNLSDLLNIFIERIPSLKEYNVFKSGDTIKLQNHKCTGEKIQKYYANELMNFDGLCINSEFILGYRYFNDRKWFYITFKNEIYPNINTRDELLKVVFNKANQMNNEKNKFSAEISLKEGETFEKFDSIINELNKKTFEFSEQLESFGDPVFTN